MKAEMVKKINAAWAAIEESDPDISTEQLAARVADMCGCDYGDVFDAILDESLEQKGGV